MTELDPDIVPASLPDALEVLKAWENGQGDLSPDGIAVALFLQRAKITRLGATATTFGMQA